MSPKVFISLCLNVGLGTLCLFIFKPGAALAAQQTSVSAAKGVKPGPEWKMLKTTEYEEYIRRLKMMFCPESTIKDIIQMDLDKVYEGKIGKLKGSDHEMEKDAQSLLAEKAALLDDLWRRTAHAFYPQYSWDGKKEYLTAEHAEKLKRLEKELEQELEEFSKGPIFDGEGIGRAMLRRRNLLQSELRQKLGSLLTPEELFEYDLRHDDLTGFMLEEYGFLGLNEEEFRKLFKARQTARKARDDRRYDEASAGEKKRQEMVEKEALAQVDEILGPERLADLKRQEEDRRSYLHLLSGIPFLGYNKEAAIKVHELKKQVIKTSALIASDQTLAPEKKRYRAEELRRNTEAAVITILGEMGYKHYQLYGGLWLKEINPEFVERLPVK